MSADNQHFVLDERSYLPLFPPEIEATCRTICRDNGEDPEQGGPLAPLWARYAQLLDTALIQRDLLKAYDQVIADMKANDEKRDQGEQRDFIGMGGTDGYGDSGKGTT